MISAGEEKEHSPSRPRAIGVIGAVILVVLVVVALWLLLREQHWDGAVDWRLVVSVRERGTGEAVQGAVVSVVTAYQNGTAVLEVFGDEQGSVIGTGTTDGQGLCTVTVQLPLVGYQSVVRSRAYVNFRHRTLHVAAAGFEESESPISELAAPWVEIRNDQTETAITVVLDRQK